MSQSSPALRVEGFRAQRSALKLLYPYSQQPKRNPCDAPVAAVDEHTCPPPFQLQDYKTYLFCTIET